MIGCSHLSKILGHFLHLQTGNYSLWVSVLLLFIICCAFSGMTRSVSQDKEQQQSKERRVSDEENNESQKQKVLLAPCFTSCLYLFSIVHVCTINKVYVFPLCESITPTLGKCLTQWAVTSDTEGHDKRGVEVWSNKTASLIWQASISKTGVRWSRCSKCAENRLY